MTNLSFKLARARLEAKRNPQGRAVFDVPEQPIADPEGARPLVAPTDAEVCKAKLEVARHINAMREKDREGK